MKKLICKIGQSVCDFGLNILAAGPIGAEEKRWRRVLIMYWRRFERKKIKNV